jgi:hypothetical protein
MTHPSPTVSRRVALGKAGKLLVAIAVVSAVPSAHAAKKKAAKDDFYFQEEPGEGGKNCKGCINFSPKPTGKYGADSGDCGLLEGDVCTHCYCQGWTDKNDPKAKKA